MDHFKFLPNASVKLTEILWRLEVQFGDKTFKNTQVCEHHKIFLGDWEAVENEV